MTGVMGDFRCKYSECTLKISEYSVKGEEQWQGKRRNDLHFRTRCTMESLRKSEKEPAELGKELDSDLKGLFDTLNSRYELVDAVIVRVQRYAAGRWRSIY